MVKSLVGGVGTLRSSSRRKSISRLTGVFEMVIFFSWTPDWLSSATIEEVFSPPRTPKELSMSELKKYACVPTKFKVRTN